jgi:hypothetical protein
MNRAVHTSSPEERAVGCIHNRIHGLRRDVTSQDMNPAAQKTLQGL